MKIKDFIALLQNEITPSVEDFEVKILLDYCRKPNYIAIEFDFFNQEAIIIKGASGL